MRMGFDVDSDDELSDGEQSECNHEHELMKVYPLRPSLFSNVPPYVQFIPVNGSYVFEVDPPEEMREMLWMVPTAPWYTISNCADLNGFTISEVRMGCCVHLTFGSTPFLLYGSFKIITINSIIYIHL